jgi:hypothetical protein
VFALPGLDRGGAHVEEAGELRAHGPWTMRVEKSLSVGEATPQCYASCAMSDTATSAQSADISRWIAECALAGEGETRILAAACEGRVWFGVGLRRATCFRRARSAQRS